MAFRSSSIKSNNNFSGATSITITAPAGIAAGDTLVAYVASGGVDTPTGWIAVNTVTSGDGFVLSALIRAVESTPPASYTFNYTLGATTSTIGALLAYTEQLSTYHGEGGSFAADATGNKTLTVAAHAVAASTIAVYGFYATSPAFANFSSAVLTSPSQATERQNALWVPADAGTARSGLAVSDESLSGATEPARDFKVTWNTTPAPTASGVANRVMIGAAGVSAGDAWAWV